MKPQDLGSYEYAGMIQTPTVNGAEDVDRRWVCWLVQKVSRAGIRDVELNKVVRRCKDAGLLLGSPSAINDELGCKTRTAPY